MKKLIRCIPNLTCILGIQAATTLSGQVLINEFVVDPKFDRNLDGLITGSDEFFEIFNVAYNEANINGWALHLIDLTPEYIVLESKIPPRGYYLISNPRGAQNDSGEIRLIDDLGNVIDSIIYGNWPGSWMASGNSQDKYNESISRYPDGSTNWVRMYATPEKRNEFNEKIRLFVKKEEDKIKVYSTNSVDREVVVQTGVGFGDWQNIYTNTPKRVFEFQTAVDSKQRFFRAIEH